MNPANKNKKLNPNNIKTRDLLMVRLIQGATKAGTHRDERKEANRRACRDFKRGDY
jgi:hypothetical protein